MTPNEQAKAMKEIEESRDRDLVISYLKFFEILIKLIRRTDV